MSSAQPGRKAAEGAGLGQIEGRRGLRQHNRTLRGSDLRNRRETGLGTKHDPAQAESQGLQSAAGCVVTVKKTDLRGAGGIDQQFPPQATGLGRSARGGEQGDGALQPKGVAYLVQIINYYGW